MGELIHRRRKEKSKSNTEEDPAPESGPKIGYNFKKSTRPWMAFGGLTGAPGSELEKFPLDQKEKLKGTLLRGRFFSPCQVFDPSFLGPWKGENNVGKKKVSKQSPYSMIFLTIGPALFIFGLDNSLKTTIPFEILFIILFLGISIMTLKTILLGVRKFSSDFHFLVTAQQGTRHFGRFPFPWRIRGRWILLGSIFFLAPNLALGQHLTIVSDSSPPLGYVKDGEIVGVTVDLIKLLLERTGIEGKFVMYPWSRAYRIAQEEKDILIYQLTYTQERARLFQLIGPIVASTDCLWKLKSRKDIVLKNLEDAKRYRIGVVKDYFVYTYLIQHGFEDGKNLEPIHDDDLNFKKLVSGRIDMMFLADIVFHQRLNELGYNRDHFEKALPVIQNEGYLGFSRMTSPDVVKRFEKALQDAKMDGSYDRIMGEYGAREK